MRILAIDTALPAVSVCVMDMTNLQILASVTREMERGHAEALMPIIQSVVESTEGGFAALDRVAVTVGPGSFTGIRVGIAAARAIGLARKIPVVGVSTLAAFAAPVISEGGADVVASAVDARHGSVYVQAFSRDGRSVIGPRAMTIREAIRSLGAGPVKLVGNAAPLMAIEAWSTGMSAEIINDDPAPEIGFVARLGYLAAPEFAPAKPLYIKAPDAKILTGRRTLRAAG